MVAGAYKQVIIRFDFSLNEGGGGRAALLLTLRVLTADKSMTSEGQTGTRRLFIVIYTSGKPRPQPRPFPRHGEPH